MSKFAFEMKQVVKLESGETGTIVGRAEYSNANPSYRLRYTDAEGRQTEAWWDEDALSAA